MGHFPNICQAELLAIERCAEINLSRGYVNKNIGIFSDSQAAIKALGSYVVTSKLAWDCVNRLNELGSRNTLTIYWVPGHNDIYGNEMADELARKGSATALLGPEPFCGVNSRLAEDVLRTNFRSSWEDFWSETPGCRQAKSLLGPLNTKRSKSLLNLSRNKIRIITAFLTGHCGLNKHLKVMGLREDAECRFCKSSDETPLHLLLDCMALVNRRRKATGYFILNIKQARKLDAATILSFLESCGLLANV